MASCTVFASDANWRLGNYRAFTLDALRAKEARRSQSSGTRLAGANCALQFPRNACLRHKTRTLP